MCSRLLFPDNEARAQAAQLAFDRALPDAIRRAVIRPMPGVRQVLDGLRAVGCQTAVVTTLPRRILDLVLEARAGAAIRPRAQRGGRPRGIPSARPRADSDAPGRLG